MMERKKVTVERKTKTWTTRTTILRNSISKSKATESTMTCIDLKEPLMNRRLISLEHNLWTQWATTKLSKAQGHANLWPLVRYPRHLVLWVRNQIMHLDVRHHLKNRMHPLFISTYCIRLWAHLQRKRKTTKLVKSQRISSYTKFQVLIWHIKLFLPAKEVSHNRYMSSF